MSKFSSYSSYSHSLPRCCRQNGPFLSQEIFPYYINTTSSKMRTLHAHLIVGVVSDGVAIQLNLIRWEILFFRHRTRKTDPSDVPVDMHVCILIRIRIIFGISESRLRPGLCICPTAHARNSAGVWGFYAIDLLNIYVPDKQNYFLCFRRTLPSTPDCFYSNWFYPFLLIILEWMNKVLIFWDNSHIWAKYFYLFYFKIISRVYTMVI